MTATLIDVRRLSLDSPHSAFTDLAALGDEVFCVFREGEAHVSPDGAIRVLVTRDGSAWETAAHVTLDGWDLRDPKLTVTPDGELMLTAAAVQRAPQVPRLRNVAWRSRDGRSFGEPADLGEEGIWLWRLTWYDGRAYGIGYKPIDFVRLYASDDGRAFEVLVPTLYDRDYPNEHDMAFLDDGTALVLLRTDRGDAHGQLGRAAPPYTDWTFTDLGVRIGGPAMLRLPDGRLIAAVRLLDPEERTALVVVDAQAGALRELLSLPSGGDTSYAGLLLHDGLLWVSYYSSHEDRTAVYLARVRL